MGGSTPGQASFTQKGTPQQSTSKGAIDKHGAWRGLQQNVPTRQDSAAFGMGPELTWSNTKRNVVLGTDPNVYTIPTQRPLSLGSTKKRAHAAEYAAGLEEKIVTGQDC